MAVERIVLCGDANCGSTDPSVLRLQVYGPGANVNRVGDDLTNGIYNRFPAAFADLLDIAAYVYAADQAVPRQRVGGDFEGNWRRCLTFRVPVRQLDLWQTREVSLALTSVLSFLSEDEYHFEFTAANFPPPDPTLWEGYGTAYDGLVDEVVLFSGGLDSLAGAVREVVTDGRRALFVNHVSNPKASTRLDGLRSLLDQRAGFGRSCWKWVRLNKDKHLSVESTQRVRSFLYATLAATYARMIGLPRVRFYENGVMSLNLPIGRQVVGARATRTTHPRVLAGFTDLFSRVAGRPLTVENPFLGLTKTDVVRSLVDAGCGDLIQYTVSCAQTRRRSNRHPHCGDCSQCLDRRFAVLAAGAEGFDPADGYEIDLVEGPRGDGGSRTLLAAYLDTATRVGRMTADQFAARYGEVGRVLRYMPGTPGEALAAVFDLYQRHARQVNGVVDRVLTRAAETGQFRNGKLPPGCLVRLMSDTQEVIEAEPSPPEPDNVFQLRGQAYRVRFQGGEENILLRSKGAAYLSHLLSRPGTSFTAVDLALQVAGRSGVAVLEGGGKLADKEALLAYRAKAVELRDDIERAKRDCDLAAEQKGQRDLEFITAEIKRCAGLGGRIQTAKDDREKVRKAVGMAIERTIEDISEFDQPLARHLDEYIRRGNDPSYTHDSLTWLT